MGLRGIVPCAVQDAQSCDTLSRVAQRAKICPLKSNRRLRSNADRRSSGEPPRPSLSSGEPPRASLSISRHRLGVTVSSTTWSQEALSLADCKGRAFTPRWQSPPKGGKCPKKQNAVLRSNAVRRSLPQGKTKPTQKQNAVLRYQRRQAFPAVRQNIAPKKQPQVAPNTVRRSNSGLSIFSK